MKNFVVFNSTGKILRDGTCQDSTFERQAKEGEFVMEGQANDVTPKVIDGKIVDKTPEEREAEKPPIGVIPEDKKPVLLAMGEWQKVLKRIDVLETKVG